MSKYSVSATVYHTWEYTTDSKEEIDAESEEEAILCLKERLDRLGADRGYACYDCCDVYNIEVTLIEEKPIRCERTMEFF